MTYTVIYRIGGTERFEWRKCVPVATFAEAVAQKDEVTRMGYAALIHRTSELDAIGLPETWESTWQRQKAHTAKVIAMEHERRFGRRP